MLLKYVHKTKKNYFSFRSVNKGKRCENTSADADLFIRFGDTKNGCFTQRIYVDRTLAFMPWSNEVTSNCLFLQSRAWINQ